MAAPKVKFKRSSVAGKVPALSNLDTGELALNTYDGKLFLKVDTGGIGIGTTVSAVNPWTENYGASGLSYTGNINVSGISTFQNKVHLLDDDKLHLGGAAGDSGDLQIYHDGTHSYIDDAGTGNLRLRSGVIEITNLAGSKTSAQFSSGSGQELYFNNNKKFETTTSGVTITGTVSATAFSGDGSALTNISAGSTANVSTNTLVVVGVSTANKLIIEGTSAATTTTDYSTVTLSGLSPAGFNTTYTRQSTGFVLDTGTVGSGNALFDTDSGYYYYVDSGSNTRMLIFSESDNSWKGVASSSAGASTEYNVITTSGLSPSSFNQTYTRQATGFVLDTGTISSGNALFKADSNYYYYVASTGSDPEDRIIIYSEEDGGWMTMYDFNDPDFREGNISDNQAVGSSFIFSAALATNSDTFNGRNVPDADDANVTYDTTKDYSSLTLDASISDFDGDYTRQSFKAKLDTGSVSSGNALFAADSTYWWFLKDSDNSKMIIYDSVAGNWTYVGKSGADFSSASDNTAVGGVNAVESQSMSSIAYESSAYQPDANYSEITYSALTGTNFTSVSNNDALGGPSGITSVTVTSGKTTADSRFVPTASGNIVYGTTNTPGGPIGVTTLTTDGSATFAGIVTATTVKASDQFYPPALTTAARDALSFTEGAMIYNTSVKRIQFYDGNSWTSLTGLGAAVAFH